MDHLAGAVVRVVTKSCCYWSTSSSAGSRPWSIDSAKSDHGWTSPRQMHTKTSRIGACRPSTSAELFSSSTTLSSVKIDAELARDLVVTRLLHHCSSRAGMFVGASQLKLATAAVISDRRQQAHACHRRFMPSTPCRLQEAGNSRLLVSWGLAALRFWTRLDLSSW